MTMQSADNITLNRLLTTVARQGATDLHLTVGAPPVIRKEGSLFLLENEEMVTQSFVERMIASFLTEQDTLILERDKDVILTHAFNKVMRFRIHIYQQKGSYSIAFRYLPLFNKKILDLGLPSYLEQVVRFKTGLVIITGVYDSGKSTTLAGIINTLNELGPPRYITTLERPVEHIFAHNKCIIEQREIGKDVATYTQGLQLALEGDIDVVVLDRLPDKTSVARKFFQVLEAGRTVISMIDAFSTLNALSKLLSLVDRSDLAWAEKILAGRLQCILMQKLVHKIGGGRILAYEFLVNMGVVSSFIMSGHLEKIATVMQSYRENDMISLEANLARLVQKGEVKLEEALMEASDKNYLKSLLR